MTRVATGQTPYLMLLHQFFAHGNLVRWRSVNGIENVFLWPDITLGMFMTVNAPPHVEGVFPPCDRHLAKLPVTRRATNSLADMNAVIEIDKVGQGVDLVPQDRLIGAVAGPHWLQHV